MKYKLLPLFALLIAGSASAELIRFGRGQATNRESVGLNADLGVGWAGRYTDWSDENNLISGASGSAGALNNVGSSVYTVSPFSPLSLSIASITGGTTLKSSGQGNVLGVTDDYMDAGESFSVTFTQNVKVMGLAFNSVSESNITYQVGSNAAVITDQANVSFASSPVLLEAGQLLTLSNASGASWRVSDIIVETIPEPASIGLIALAGGAIIALRRNLMI